MIYYLYRHIRQDKNEVFYIGFGTVNSKGNVESTKFRRAFSKKRTQFWKNIVSKTNYNIEIFFLSKDKALTLKKEEEFIKIYGRKNSGGTLANMSDGGEKTGKGAKRSKEHCQKLSKRMKNFWAENISPRSKAVYQYDLQGNLLNVFKSLRGTNIPGLHYKTIQGMLQLKNKSFLKYGFFFSYEELTPEEVLNKITERKNYNKYANREFPGLRNIKQLDLNHQLIKIWSSTAEIIKFYGITRGAILYAIKHYDSQAKSMNSYWTV